MKSRLVLAIGLWACVASSAGAQEAEPQPTPEPAPAEPVTAAAAEADPTPAPESESKQEESPLGPSGASLPHLEAAPPTRIELQSEEEGTTAPGDDIELAQPRGEPLPTEARVIRLAKPLPSHSRGSADAGVLEGLQALEVRPGMARVVLADGSERTLRPGDVVGEDVVRRVTPGQILLHREAREGEPGGSATVVVKLDGGGRAKVFVFWTSNPPPANAPEVQR